jgi:arsenate reductase
MNVDAVTIYHNPACGTSRNTLALIRNAGPPSQNIAVRLTAQRLLMLTSFVDRQVRERYDLPSSVRARKI